MRQIAVVRIHVDKGNGGGIQRLGNLARDGGLSGARSAGHTDDKRFQPTFPPSEKFSPATAVHSRGGAR